MTLPQATAFEINPADLIPKTLRRKDWFAPRTTPTTRPEPIDQPVTRIYMSAPKERVWTRQHDSHMAAYYEWKANGPLGWLKMRCRDMGVAYSDIVGRSRHRELIEPRHRLMAQMKAEFPHMTLPHIGRMFDRDHSVVYFAIRKMDIGASAKKPPIGYRADEVRRLLDSNASMRSIGRDLGYDYKTVANYVKRMGWKR